jgi:hypothetical protein
VINQGFQPCQSLFREVLKDIFSAFLVGGKILLQQIREKEYLKHDKNDKELDKDDHPELFTHGHAPEAIVIEEKDPVNNRCIHRLLFCVSKDRKIRKERNKRV